MVWLQYNKNVKDIQIPPGKSIGIGHKEMSELDIQYASKSGTVSRSRSGERDVSIYLDTIPIL